MDRVIYKHFQTVQLLSVLLHQSQIQEQLFFVYDTLKSGQDRIC